MKRFKSYVTEIFNQPYPHLYLGSNEEEHQTDDPQDTEHTYGFNAHDKDGNLKMMQVNIMHQAGDEEHPSVYFKQRSNSDDNKNPYNMTNDFGHNSVRVLSTVGNILQAHKNKMEEEGTPIKSFDFSSDKSDKGREKAYGAITKRYGGKANTKKEKEDLLPGMFSHFTIPVNNKKK
jgi:hypothetical protein